MTNRSEELQKKYDEQTTEQFAAIGHFVQEFGQICYWLQFDFIQLLSDNGLKDQAISNIVIGNRAITAEPLIQIMEGLVGHLLDEENENERIGKEVFRHAANRFRNLVKIRNDIVHGTWFIGWGNDAKTDFSKISGVKLNPNRNGFEIKNLPHSIEEIRKHIDEAKQLDLLFRKFFACWFHGRMEPGKGVFVRNFTKTSDGRWVPEPPE